MATCLAFGGELVSWRDRNEAAEGNHAAPDSPCDRFEPGTAGELESLVRAHSTPQQLARRARIILLAGKGVGLSEAADRLGMWRKTVSCWRQRWLAGASAESVGERLADIPRPGGPPTFTPDQICSIIALACEPPERADCRSASGARANWRERRRSGAWWRASRSARWGAF